jgi:serine phosphatase RsbU (regulator of sigma subunit)/PAS domain-containing protein
VGVEPALPAFLGASAAAAEPLLDALPLAVVLAEPGSRRPRWANRAARELLGEAPDLARLLGGAGAADAHRRPVEWRAGGALRRLVVTARTVAPPGTPAVVVVACEDVTPAPDASSAVLDALPEPVVVQDDDHRVVYANAAATRALGFERTAGRPPDRERFDLLDADGRRLDPAALPGRRVLAGETPEPLVLRHRHRGTGAVGWSRVLAEPVGGEGDPERFAVVVAEDVTGLHRALEGQRLLAESSRILAGSLDDERTVPAVARAVVRGGLADWCIVELFGPDGGDRVAAAHAEPSLRALGDELRRRYGPPRGVIDAIMADHRPRLWREVTGEMLARVARDATHLGLLQAIGLVSAIVVPVVLRERVLGTLSFMSARSGRRYDEQDLALAEDVALRIGAAVESAGLYRETRAVSRALQTTLLPPDLPEVPGMELAATYRPAGEGLEVGGDFYDAFTTAEDQWYLVIGDVCGKGAEAAAVTALARWTIRAAAARRRSPAEILHWLHEAMLREHGADGRYVTIACAHLDLAPPAPRLTVACAGHPLPVLLRAGGGSELIGAPGTLLGLPGTPVLRERSTVLAPGDALVLYTDGLTEARAPAVQWTPDDLLAVVRQAAGQEPAACVRHLVAAALPGQAPPRDDLAVLVARREPAPEG